MNHLHRNVHRELVQYCTERDIQHPNDCTVEDYMKMFSHISKYIEDMHELMSFLEVDYSASNIGQAVNDAGVLWLRGWVRDNQAELVVGDYDDEYLDLAFILTSQAL